MEDRFGHRISYLRVSITDRCNERCNYCMPRELQEWLPREEILSYEETLRLIRVAADLGVTKIRVTGGEPLTRRDVTGFVREIPKIGGITNLGISTNGTLLARTTESGQSMAAALRDAGAQSLNISLDTLDRDFYAQIGSDPDQAQSFFVTENIFARQPFLELARHAIVAAFVTTIRDRDAQIGNAMAVTIFHEKAKLPTRRA